MPFTYGAQTDIQSSKCDQAIILYNEIKVCLIKPNISTELCSVLRPRQHSIGYMGDGFYRSKETQPKAGL